MLTVPITSSCENFSVAVHWHILLSFTGEIFTFLNCRKLALHRINTFSDKTSLYFLLLVHDSRWAKLFHLSHSIFPAIKAALWKRFGTLSETQQEADCSQPKVVLDTDYVSKHVPPFCWELYWNILVLTAHNLLTQFHLFEIPPVVLLWQGVHPPPTASKPPLRCQLQSTSIILFFKPCFTMYPLYFDLQASQDCVSWLNHVTNLNLLSLGFFKVMGWTVSACVKQSLCQPQPAGTARSAKWCEDMIVIIIALLNLYWTKVFCYTSDPCTFIHLVLAPETLSKGLFVAAVSLMCTSGGWASGCCSAWQSLNASTLLNTWYMF